MATVVKVKAMPRKKQAKSAAGSPTPMVQLGIRVPVDLADRLTETATGLGLDTTSLVRMIVLEHIHIYEERVARIQGRKVED
jgi:hypothetical protein